MRCLFNCLHSMLCRGKTCVWFRQSVTPCRMYVRPVCLRFFSMFVEKARVCAQKRARQ